MPAALLAGIAALADRSRGALAALAGATVAGAGPGPGAGGPPGSLGASPLGDALADDMDIHMGPLGPGGWTGIATSPHALHDFRRLLVWFAAAVLVLVLVAVTNPTEASFRSHLTELAFRRHLAHIRSSDDPEVPASAAADGARHPPSTTASPPNGASSGADTPPIAPFRFANHVAITLRTPTLCYRSYFFLALAFAAAPAPPAFLSDPVPAKHTKHASGPPAPEPTLAYLGVLGHWFVLGHVPAFLHWAWRLVRAGRRGDKSRKKASALDRPGVLEMRAVLPKDEQTVSTTTTSTSGRGLVPPKLLFRTESHKDLADLLPTLTTPTTSAFGPESRRGSIVNLIAPQPPTPPEPDTPALVALKAELVAAQNVLTELQTQLATHDESVAAAQAHLQSTVDELRQRRKEDDAERQDLKSKAKTLEDQKRQAEAARREAEKRLKAVESIRDSLQSKIGAARDKIEDLRGNMEVSEKNIRIVSEEGAHHVLETRESVDTKTNELGVLEKEIAQLETTNDTLCQQVRQAEDKLHAAESAAEDARKIAPEEEMMLMAAAYEAAASETYLKGQRQTQADSQWASQAAAYMAEAGMPFLDQSYTARPAQTASTGYGHLSRAHPNNASYRSLVDQRGVADVPVVPAVPGFEDFGPGAGGSRSLAAQRRSPTPIQTQTQTQQQQQPDEHEELGSAHGPMSASFPNSWLPQGLVRSLEGDITPLDSGASDAVTDDGDVLLSSIHDALATSPTEPDGSGSDSGADSPHWPTHDHEQITFGRNRHVGAGAPGTRFQGAPAFTGSASTFPGIGPPSSSRRWFSSSPSSENVSSSFHFGAVGGVGSSDSLPLAPGFESPFAPSASEKRALKWPLLGKSRWSGNGNRSISSLDEISAGLKDIAGGSGSGSGSGASFAMGSGANGLSAEELFNRVPAPGDRPGSLDLAPAPAGNSSWLTSRPFAFHHSPNQGRVGQGGHSHGIGGLGGLGNLGGLGHSFTFGRNHDQAGSNHADDANETPSIGTGTGENGSAVGNGGVLDVLGDDERVAERKPSFRFFSLRKGAKDSPQ